MFTDSHAMSPEIHEKKGKKKKKRKRDMQHTLFLSHVQSVLPQKGALTALLILSGMESSRECVLLLLLVLLGVNICSPFPAAALFIIRRENYLYLSV